MNKRLLKVAELINKSNMVIDVGCDHALLSIFLIQNKIANSVINIDCNLQPLKNGELNVLKHNLQNKIKFILNNGLENLNIKNIDYITICGMGTQNIIDIISKSSVDPNYYILQSNCNISKLRKWLFQNKYIIIDEVLVVDNNIYYEILKIKKSFNPVNWNERDVYIGPIFKKCNNIELKKYFLNRYNYLKQFNYDIVSEELKNEYTNIREFCYEKEWIS